MEGAPISTLLVLIGASLPSSYPDGACVSMDPTPTGNGYWTLNGSTGAVTEKGGAVSYGTPAATFPGAPRDLIPSFHQIAATRDGKGYWVLEIGLGGLGSAAAFGDPRFYGSVPGLGIRSSDVVCVAVAPTGRGYWLLRADGKLFASEAALLH